MGSSGYWKSTWDFITPVLIVVIIIFSWTNRSPDQFMDYVFPEAIQAYGWFLELLPILITVTFMAVLISRRIMSGQDTSFIQAGVMLTPKKSWGPRSDRFDGEEETEVGVSNNGFSEGSETITEKLEVIAD